ncbi:MAG: UDP-2,4-diacetamido-2,4,6-trideoxy-beta-L-altropyranose hydrolase [Burkholderiales bacterium]|nr:UDP-2,4-diacetamido-2,4,6-trideoxy-beta-L-altropyranose hydrolase [Burkholderiales bacterium]
MKIAFRVDASSDIGTGHVRRCLSLAAALRRRGVNSFFVTRDLGVAAFAQIRAEDFGSFVLPAPGPNDRWNHVEIPHAAWAGVAWETDAEQTIAALRSSPPDWLVIDHYSFDARWHRRVATALGCQIAVIDDLGDRMLDADLLVDHNVSVDHRAKYHGRLPAHSAMLTGPTYALLGPAYADAARHVVRHDVRSIGIFMGGIDQGNYSSMALSACREGSAFDGEIEIVSTRSNPNLYALEQAVTRWPKTRLTLDLADLAAFFARHDLQVGAAGGAMWERCCIGAPTLAISVADNQQQVLMPLANLGVVSTLDVPSVDPYGLTSALRALIGNAVLRQRLSDRAKGLVDGLGARRVAEYLVRP